MENQEQILIRMKEDILLRGLSKSTMESYPSKAQSFLEYCKHPAKQLNEQDIRNFLCYLIKEKKVAPATVILTVQPYGFSLP